MTRNARAKATTDRRPHRRPQAVGGARAHIIWVYFRGFHADALEEIETDIPDAPGRGLMVDMLNTTTNQSDAAPIDARDDSPTGSMVSWPGHGVTA